MRRVVASILLVGCGPGAMVADPVVAIAESRAPESVPQRKAAPSGACSLRTDGWSPGEIQGDGAPLFVEGQHFFAIYGGSLALKLSANVSADAIPVQVASMGLSLRGTLASQHVPLHLRRPIVFEEAVIPTSAARLSWSGIDAQGIVVTHHLEGGVEADRLRASVPCRDLALTPESFELPNEFYDPERGRVARIREDQRVPLSTSPGGAPVIWIDLSKWEPEGWSDRVRELAFDGNHSRIAWKRDRELVFGWVPGNAVLGLLPDDYDSFGGSGMGLIGTGVASGENEVRRRCKQPVTLSASIEGGAKREVGTLATDTPFDVVDDTEEASHVSIWVPEVFDSVFIPQPGVEIWITAEAFARCK